MELQKKAQKFLIDNNCDDLVLNRAQYRENTPENAQKWIYASELMAAFAADLQKAFIIKNYPIEELNFVFKNNDDTET